MFSCILVPGPGVDVGLFGKVIVFTHYPHIYLLLFREGKKSLSLREMYFAPP